MDTVEQLMVTDIRTDGGTQSRVVMDDEIVAEYADCIDDLPPIHVYFDSQKYWLVDGFHRLRAHKSLKLTEIRAKVELGTQQDAILASLSANSSHGLKRTNADKRKAVETVLRDPQWKIWPNTKIARVCAVHEKLVRRMKDELAERVAPEGQPSASRVSAPIVPSTTDIDVAEKVKEIFDRGGEPVIVDRGDEQYAQDVSKLGKYSKAKAAPSNDQTTSELPIDPAKPWAETQAAAERVKALLRQAADEYRKMLGYDSSTKQITNPWCQYYTFGSTVGAINTLIKEADECLPSEMTKATQWGYINKRQKVIMAGLVPGAAAA